jgi:hypothetical protein
LKNLLKISLVFKENIMDRKLLRDVRHVGQHLKGHLRTPVPSGLPPGPAPVGLPSQPRGRVTNRIGQLANKLRTPRAPDIPLDQPLIPLPAGEEPIELSDIERTINAYRQQVDRGSRRNRQKKLKRLDHLLTRSLTGDQPIHKVTPPRQLPISPNYWPQNYPQSSQSRANQAVNEARFVLNRNGDNRQASEVTHRQGRRGNFHRSFQVYLNDLKSHQQLTKFLREQVFNRAQNAFSINISFGYIYEQLFPLMAVEDAQVFTQDPYDVRHLWQHPMVVRNVETFNEMTAAITNEAIMDHGNQPDSSTVVLGVFSMMARITPLRNVMGSDDPILPAWLNISRDVRSLANAKHNLCLWYALASAEGLRPDRLKERACALFEWFYDEKPDKYYEGFDLNNLEDIEQRFQLAITVFEASDTSPEAFVSTVPPPMKVIRRSECEGKPLALLLTRGDGSCVDHLSHITSVDKFIKHYQCNSCNQLFSEGKACHRHEKTCVSIAVPELFPNYPYQFELRNNAMVKTAESLGVPLPDPFYDWVATWQLETLTVQPMIFDPETGRVIVDSQSPPHHIPVAVVVETNVPGIQSPWRGRPEELLQFLHHVQATATMYTCAKFNAVLKHFTTENPASPQLSNFVYQLPVVGFKSGRFDLNVHATTGLFTQLVQQGIQLAIKPGNNYLALATDRLLFLDIFSYVPSTTTKEQFLGTGSDGTLLSAVLNKRDYYRTLGIDLLKDSMTGSGVAERRMYRSAERAFERFSQLDRLPPKPSHALAPHPSTTQQKITYYLDQDIKAGRVITAPMTHDQIVDLLERFNYRCHYCHEVVINSWTLDRLDCSLDHCYGNCIIACADCNCARGNRSYHSFYIQAQKRRFNQVSPQVFVIGGTNAATMYHLIKNNMVGGPALVFHRYHEVGKTRIQRCNKTINGWEQAAPGALVQSIQGIDANNLYVWCVAQEMPCGVLEYLEGPFDPVALPALPFGFVEVDIHVPDQQRFSEFAPIFKHVNGQLVSSFFGERILVYTPLLQWYVDHGLVVTAIYSVIAATPGSPFKGFADEIANARREADRTGNSLMADCAKFDGVSAVGRSAMDTSKFTKTFYYAGEDGENKLMKARQQMKVFQSDETIDTPTGTYHELTRLKNRVLRNLPIHISKAVYDLAKLRMLQTYYDFIDRFVPREKFQLLYMDTDSFKIAWAGRDMSDCVRSRQEFEQSKSQWLVPDGDAYAKRTPGLFKLEAEYTAFVGLNAKCYYGSKVGGVGEQKASGVQKHNEFSLDKYKRFLCADRTENEQATEKTQRIVDRKVVDTVTPKIGLANRYTKRGLFTDGIGTYPLDA